MRWSFTVELVCLHVKEIEIRWRAGIGHQRQGVMARGHVEGLRFNLAPLACLRDRKRFGQGLLVDVEMKRPPGCGRADAGSDGVVAFPGSGDGIVDIGAGFYACQIETACGILACTGDNLLDLQSSLSDLRAVAWPRPAVVEPLRLNGSGQVDRDAVVARIGPRDIHVIEADGVGRVIVAG